jgi:DNA-binding winged helix-turn-helix (wHTH) protein
MIETSELFGMPVDARDACSGNSIAPIAVRNHRGETLLLKDLPSPDVKRWVIGRKADVIAAVNGGLLSQEDALKRYRISVEEFRSWQDAVKQEGIKALRVTLEPTLREYSSARGVAPSGIYDANEVIAYGDVVIRPGPRIIQGPERVMRLTRREMAILMIIGRSEIAVSRRSIFEYLYAGYSPLPKIKTLDVFICHLRTKLKIVSRQVHIATVWGLGYELVIQE